MSTAPASPETDSSLFAIAKAAVTDFIDDNCMRLAAAMSYYTVFALPALLVLLVTIVGWYAGVTGTGGEAGGSEVIKEQVGNVTGLDGPEEQEQIDAMLHSAQMGNASPWKWILTFGGILFGATGVVVALQDALNTAWEVMPDPEKGGVWNFVTKRLVSLAMILGVGFLLIVSLTITAAVQGMTAKVGEATGLSGGGMFLAVMNEILTVLVVGTLFGAMFKFLPDAHIAWKDVVVGALVTAGLFWVGKFGLGIYLGRANFADSFGSGAASLAMVFVWVYYTSLIFLFGAELTQKWADRRGSGIVPEDGAVRVKKELQPAGAGG
ncbi:YihY/virulence factor BrkB family protein [Alienimonas sp. DA493]|uniref:YihY/virulence factor BrkB family protein n=1 Tax=Alienimonas sp. DA493 TaxID=3373605 RepID=UPI0037550355